MELQDPFGLTHEQLVSSLKQNFLTLVLAGNLIFCKFVVNLNY